MRKLNATLTRLLAPFSVLVSWEGMNVTHRTWTYGAALEWAKCYPKGAHVVIGSGFSVIASRS